MYMSTKTVKDLAAEIGERFPMYGLKNRDSVSSGMSERGGMGVSGIFDEDYGEIVAVALLSWIDEVEQSIYNNILEFYHSITIGITDASTDIPIMPTYDLMGMSGMFLFEDIRKFEVKHGAAGRFEEYSPCTIAYVPAMSYYQELIGLNYSDPKDGDTVRIVFRWLPPLKIMSMSMDELHLYLPDRFIFLYKYYIFAQILMLTKEYDESNNWMAMYNAEVEDFRAWYLANKSAYGG